MVLRTPDPSGAFLMALSVLSSVSHVICVSRELAVQVFPATGDAESDQQSEVVTLPAPSAFA